ncbi:MAG: hypothetical protein AAFU79_02375 [Myxococcota bacterium]
MKATEPELGASMGGLQLRLTEIRTPPPEDGRVRLRVRLVNVGSEGVFVDPWVGNLRLVVQDSELKVVTPVSLGEVLRVPPVCSFIDPGDAIEWFLDGLRVVDGDLVIQEYQLLPPNHYFVSAEYVSDTAGWLGALNTRILEVEVRGPPPE